MRLTVRRRDPYWDLDGRTVRRDRRLRKVLSVLVAFAVLALLVMVFRPMNARAAGTGVNLDQWATRHAVSQNSPATPRPFFSPPPTSTAPRDIAPQDPANVPLFLLLTAIGVIAAWRDLVVRRRRGTPRS
jgi:hypothetical protein